MNALAFVTKSLAASDTGIARAFAPTQSTGPDAVNVWAADVERAEASAGPLSADAHFAINALRQMRNPGPAEFAAIFAQLFRTLKLNAHVRQYRDAMAGCCDIVEDFAAMARQDLAETLVADPSDPDTKYETRRDEGREFA